MPLYSTRHINDHSVLAVWRIEEGVDELRRQVYLSKKDEEMFATFHSEKRCKEWLASRLLTQMMLEEDVSISYEPTGKPYILNSEWEISITHKNEFIGVVLGKNRRVAVDIELLSTRLDKVYDYFLRPEELNSLVRGERSFQLHLIWCAKECLVKIANRKDLRVLEDMYVHPINPRKNKFVAEVREDNIMIPYTFFYERLSHDYVVVWTSDTEKVINLLL
ncbi:4'-phosphopantetheinyl transferase superfamily protein [Balneicella halophila]|uniref:4'-phosphopantetheinyl transferase superfamily protein n=1 Tax=Balneicella halophila TaxID=1537566 RepID=A0A7L4UMV0_BALHA|nr:4'-phosphopantetheinyl transferase family protein [Balneicella halophila]PVX49954.1 4'-phosphopantetheinyl transferase superfamily protein [Balneicella halophila]